MYINKCTKCGAEFETKNPKRIICPNCLYPDKKPLLDSAVTGSETNQEGGERPQMRSSYSYEGNSDEAQRPYPQRSNYNNQRSYNRPQGDYQNNRSNYQRNSYNQGGYNNNRQGGYNRPSRPNGNYNRTNNNRSQGGYNRTQQGNFRRPQQNRRPSAPRAHKELLVTKEQVAQIEVLYKRMLPLPNPDAHEIIGKEIGLEPRKVFFGINLVRQKMFLPKMPYPKRKLAVSQDQLLAIKNLYEPLLPLPPIGCHKIIASQLKMDEWRVHVGIGLVRKQMGLGRWNEDRADAPAQIIRPRKGLSEHDKVLADDARLSGLEVKSEQKVEDEALSQVEEAPKKTTRKKKTVAVEDAAADAQE